MMEPSNLSVDDGLGPHIPPEVLERAILLPKKLDVPTLKGRHFAVIPLCEEHVPALIRCLSGKACLGQPEYDAYNQIWKYMRGFKPGVVTEAVVRDFMLRIRDMDDGRTFVVVDLRTNDIVGTTSLISNRPSDLSVEIGAISFTPAYQGTAANTESVFLLLDWAFSQGYRRVEWKCNNRNERSKAAALRLGFTFEGIFRQHMIVAGDRSRDTAWYSILDHEWPEKRAALADWLSSDAPSALLERKAKQLAASSAAASTSGAASM